MALTERLALLITADANQAVRELDSITGATNRVADSTPRLQRLGDTMTRTLTPAAIGAGAAFMTAFNEFDAGADSLRAAGAAGDQFTDSMRNVGNRVPEDLGQVGEVMGQVYQRTRLTGPALEELTQRVVELGRLGQDVSVEELTASLAKGGVEAEDMADALDTMYRVTQTTGTGVADLASLQERFGAILAETGLPLEQQLLLLGQMEAQGVNTESVLGGLTRGYRELAVSTEDPAAALEDLLNQMADAETQAEATAIGNDVFGRSAVEVAAAAQSGALDIEALTAAYEGNTDTVHEAAEGTLDWADRLSMLQNRVVGVIGPFGELGFAISGIAAVAGPAMSGVSRLSSAIGNSRTGQFASGWLQANNAIGALPALAPAAAVGLGALAYGLQQNAQAAAEFHNGINEVADALAQGSDPVDLFTAQVDDLVLSNNDVRDAFVAAGLSTREYAEIVNEGGPALDALGERLRDTGLLSEDARTELGFMTEQFRRGKDAAAEAAPIISQAGDEIDGVADAAGRVPDSMTTTVYADTAPFFAAMDRVFATVNNVLSTGLNVAVTGSFAPRAAAPAVSAGAGSSGGPSPFSRSAAPVFLDGEAVGRVTTKRMRRTALERV